MSTQVCQINVIRCKVYVIAHPPPLFSCDKHKANMWKDKPVLVLSKRKRSRQNEATGRHTVVWTPFCSGYGCVGLGSRGPKGFERNASESLCLY